MKIDIRVHTDCNGCIGKTGLNPSEAKAFLEEVLFIDKIRRCLDNNEYLAKKIKDYIANENNGN